jgi:hypothetical protein
MSDPASPLPPTDEADEPRVSDSTNPTPALQVDEEDKHASGSENRVQRKAVRNLSLGLGHPHEGHCFVVMPYGRSPAEVRWFRGWYDVVIEKAVSSAGYIPILSATEERPNAINDEIRAHLAFDPMVVVDLGGIDPDVDPNPNVMYELGIRHALSLPLVMMAWQNQRLPFDVGNQRVIVESQ